MVDNQERSDSGPESANRREEKSRMALSCHEKKESQMSGSPLKIFSAKDWEGTWRDMYLRQIFACSKQ